ncbi:NXPE family member 2-like isoform X1 [Clavelina lepadiformis]|uniref:NXPE family member 2-like isoform X1 n=2 Tax=Clavelina lepadiformis TaxID=159417 RepID=UPI0040430001
MCSASKPQNGVDEMLSKKKKAFAALVTIGIFLIFFQMLFFDRPLLKIYGQVKPSETLDPNSPYYGNIYQDRYGQPVRNASIYTNETYYTDWKQHFPEIILSMEKYKLQNPTHNPKAFTKSTSTVSLENSKANFKVGDTLVAHIQAKDGFNQDKTFGGDYFRARLICRSPNGTVTDGIACKIEDHLNGSYTLRVPLLMAGTFTLEVKLVIPVEGIDWFMNFTSIHNNKGLIYTATLQTKEEVQCNIDLNTYDGYEDKLMCDYGNPRDGEPWFCLLPPSGKCSPITYLVCRESHRQSFPKVSDGIVQIEGSGRQITVSTETFNFDATKMHAPFVYLHQGYWMKTLNSKLVTFREDFRKCLENTSVYMFGDSTMRQFFQELARIFNLAISGPDSTHVWQQPKIAQSKDTSSNISFYYRGHGPPFRNPGPPSSRPYITDSIDNIKVESGRQVYVIFTIGLHPLFYEPSLYIRRLSVIKKTIIRHHKLFPNTIFVVKGMNVVEWNEEWLILRYEVLLRDAFKNMPNVFYLKLWDMTVVAPLYQRSSSAASVTFARPYV